MKKINNKFSLIFLGAALVHIILLILFIIEKKPALSFVNGALLICFIVLAIKALDKRNLNGCYIVCTIAVVMHIVIHQMAMGNKFEFQIIYIGAVPILFFVIYEGKRKLTKVLIVVASILMFCIAGSVVACIFPPVVTVSIVSEIIIILINTFIAFSAAAGFVWLFSRKVLADAGVLQKQNTNLETSANYDALTGLRNRRSVDNYIDKAFMNARGEGRDFAILMCDIDDFKKVNDTYGHDAGDEVLKMVSNILKGTLRGDDVVFRWGGEEILVIVDGNKFCAQKVAERCRSAIEQSMVDYKGSQIKVTITIGGASYFQGSTKEVLIERADDNLYKGKKNGKNQVVF